MEECTSNSIFNFTKLLKGESIFGFRSIDIDDEIQALYNRV